MGSLNLNLNSMKKIGLTIARWAVGILFLFSGIAKGIDPVGFEYKLSDYIDALQHKILDILVTPGAFLLPFAEFLIGITLLTGILIRISTKVALGFMLIFTPLTLYIALKNPVTDCGCFGDALVITNWETFYKKCSADYFGCFTAFKPKEPRFSNLVNIPKNHIFDSVDKLYFGCFMVLAS